MSGTLDISIAPLSLSDIALIALGILTIYLVSALLWDQLRRQRRRTRIEGARFERLREFAAEKEELLVKRQIQSAGLFLEKPRFYYYLDPSTAESLYNEIAPSIRTIELEEESSKESQRGISARITGIGGFFRRKSILGQKEKKKIVETIESKVDAIVRYYVENDKAILGLEDFEIDDSWENGFRGMNETITRQYGRGFNENEIKEAIRDRNNGLGSLKITQMAEANGIALITGRFIIASGTEGFELSLRHPVGKWVAKDIRINASCTNHLTDAGKEMFPRMTDIQVAILARTMKLSGNILLVKPIAIYGK